MPPIEKEDDGVIKDIIPKEGEDPSKKDGSEVEKTKEPEKSEKVDPSEFSKPEESEEKETQEEKEEEAIDWEAKAKKLEEERDNYKKALLSTKSKELRLSKDEDKKEEENSKWDEESKEFQKETLSKSEQIVRRQLEKMNERGAIRRFLKRYPEVAQDNLKWNDIASAYKPTRGKDTSEDILEDLEDSYLVLRRKDGSLKRELEEARKKGEHDGAVKAKSAQMASVSGAGNHSVSKSDSKKELTSNAKKMAERMRTPLDKLEKEDDSTTAVIRM